MLFALSRFVAMASERKLKAKLTCYAVDDPVNGVTVGSPTPRGEFREVKEYPGGPVSLDVDRSAVSRCFCRRSFDDHALPHSPRGESSIGSLPEDRSTRPLREFTVPFPLRDPFFAVSATFMQAETLSRKGSRPRHLLRLLGPLSAQKPSPGVGFGYPADLVYRLAFFVRLPVIPHQTILDFVVHVDLLE